MWFEARGKGCKTLEQLETIFKKAYGPNPKELGDLKVKIQSQKHYTTRVSVHLAHQILMLNQELGTHMMTKSYSK